MQGCLLHLNAALSPEQIRKFFEAVVHDAEEILAWFKLSQQHRDAATMASIHTAPSLIV